jgi:ribonuclease E
MTEDVSTELGKNAAPGAGATKKAAARKTAAKKPAARASAAETTAPAEAGAAAAVKKAAAKKTTAKKAAANKSAAKKPASRPAAGSSPAADVPATDVPASTFPATESPVTAALADASDGRAADAAATAGVPAKRAARKRAPRAGSPVPDSPASDSPARQSPVSESPSAAGGEPASGEATAAGRRTRSRRSAGAGAATAPEPTDPASDDPVTGDALPEAGDGRGSRRRSRSAAPTFSAGASAGDPAAPETTARAAGGRAVAPPFAVVFQPPVDEAAPVARSRRRGAPAAPIEDEPVTDEDELLDGGAADDAGAGEVSDDADEDPSADSAARRRRRRGRRGRGRARSETGADTDADPDAPDGDGQADAQPDGDATSDEPRDSGGDDESSTGTRRRRRRRSRSGGGADGATDDPPNTVVRVRQPRNTTSNDDDEVRGIAGSTRMEAKRQRRREGREQGRRRPPILSEAEFLARREAVDRVMVVRQTADRTQIAVLEDGILVEHYVTRADAISYVGNVYLGRVQNVLPSMEAAFIDISKGRNGVLYAGEVNYDASQFDGRPHRIESALKSGQSVLVQVTKDPIGHKGARLTSQVSLPGRYLVYVPEGSMTGISRKLPENERNRLKNILKQIVPEDAGVIVRTAAEGASEEELTRDIARLQAQWDSVKEKAAKASGGPTLLYGEPDLVIRVVRDIFNEDFTKLVVSGRSEWEMVEQYVETFAPELRDRVEHWTAPEDVFAAHRVDEQLVKALDRKVWLPSGGSLVIDRTEAMVVVDVNTGKFVGKGGNLEETVTKNNIEAAEEIVRQLRLRDLGGIIVIDFIDMVLESNRELVLRRLIECLGRDRTKHQVAEVTSLGLVQMTRKRVGQGLLEAFSETCEACNGRGIIVSLDPKVPGAPGNGRGSKQEHRHDKGRPDNDRNSGDKNSGDKTGGDKSGNARGEGGRADRGDKRTPAGTTATASATPAETGEASGGGSGRRRRGRRGGGGDSANVGNGATSGDVISDAGDAGDAATAEAAVEVATESRREAVAHTEPTTVALVDEALDIDADGAGSSRRPARRRRKTAAAVETG